MGRQHIDTSLGANSVYLNSLYDLFNRYQNNFGDLFILINSNDIKQLYLFNCGEDTFFGIYDYSARTKNPMTRNIANILESLDYTDSKVEWWIKDAIDKNIIE